MIFLHWTCLPSPWYRGSCQAWPRVDICVPSPATRAPCGRKAKSSGSCACHVLKRDLLYLAHDDGRSNVQWRSKCISGRRDREECLRLMALRTFCCRSRTWHRHGGLTTLYRGFGPGVVEEVEGEKGTKTFASVRSQDPPPPIADDHTSPGSAHDKMRSLS